MSISKEKLENISHSVGLEPCDYEEVFGSITTGEIVSMARELLASRAELERLRAQEPVAWEVKGILCHTLADARCYIGEPEPLYAEPKPLAVPVSERTAFNEWNNDTDCPMAGLSVKDAAWRAWSHRASMSLAVPDENGLLPCPCCGGAALFDYDEDNLNWISCTGCGLSTDTTYHDDEDACDKLRRLWNRRAAMLQSHDGTLIGEGTIRNSNSPAVPDGWVLVPKEPTQAMINAWLSEVANFRGHAAGYRAMLEVVPAPPEVK